MLIAAQGRSADLPLSDTYLEICRTAADEFGSGGDGRTSIRVQGDGTLTVSIWRVDGDGTDLGTFCDFSGEPRRLAEAYLTPCYHCGFTLAPEEIERLNRRFFGK
ncbi:MAG: hypothetical protein ABIY37_14815 [Devosia sp.]